MAKFAYNNAKNASTSHSFFDLNYGYYSRIFYKEVINLNFKSKLVEELSIELGELMTVCWKNLHHAQKFQKQAHNKIVKPRS